MDESKPCGYDAQMIEDFLDHLILEVNINIFECRPDAPVLTNEDLDGGIPPGMDPELIEKLVTAADKHNCAALQVSKVLDMDSGTETEVKTAGDSFAAERLQRFKQYLNALAILKPLFKEALFCIQQQAEGPKLLVQTLTVQELKEKRNEQSPSDVQDP